MIYKNQIQHFLDVIEFFLPALISIGLLAGFALLGPANSSFIVASVLCISVFYLTKLHSAIDDDSEDYLPFMAACIGSLAILASFRSTIGDFEKSAYVSAMSILNTYWLSRLTFEKSVVSIRTKIPWVLAAIVTAAVGFEALTPNLSNIFPIYSSLLGDLLITVTLFYLLISRRFPNLIENTSWQGSYESSPQRVQMSLALLFFGVFSSISTRIIGLHFQWDAANFTAPMMYIPFLFDLSFERLRVRKNKLLNLSIGQRLISRSSKKFLDRFYRRKHRPWAVTSACQSTSYLVDHDPFLSLQNSLPATIEQIRKVEINKCFDQILKDPALFQEITGHSVQGVMDPESCFRPCVEALKLFSCLYLDAGPALEKRLTGLMTILPLIDAPLHNVLSLKPVSDLLQRSRWFFYMDHWWVDQNLTQTGGNSRFTVTFRNLDLNT